MSDETDEIEDEPSLDNWTVRLEAAERSASRAPLLALAVEAYGEANWWRAVAGQGDDTISRLEAMVESLESRRGSSMPPGSTWRREETRGDTTISLSGSAATEREGLRLPDAAPPDAEPRRDPDPRTADILRRMQADLDRCDATFVLPSDASPAPPAPPADPRRDPDEDLVNALGRIREEAKVGLDGKKSSLSALLVIQAMATDALRGAPPPAEPRQDPETERFEEALTTIHREASRAAHVCMAQDRREFERLAHIAHESLHALRPHDLPTHPEKSPP